MLNWIVWNRTVYLYKIDLALNNLQRLICHKPKQTNNYQLIAFSDQLGLFLYFFCTNLLQLFGGFFCWFFFFFFWWWGLMIFRLKFIFVFLLFFGGGIVLFLFCLFVFFRLMVFRLMIFSRVGLTTIVMICGTNLLITSWRRGVVIILLFLFSRNRALVYLVHPNE